MTSGAEYLRDDGSSRVTITGAAPTAITNGRLVDTALVPLTGTDAIGNGVGLPTAANQTAGSLTPRDWANREVVPAIIQPYKSSRSVHFWQLVFGLQEIHTGQRATLDKAVVTVKDGHRTYRLQSNVHLVIEANGVTDSRC